MKTILPHTASDFCVDDERKGNLITRTSDGRRKFRVLSKEEFDAAMNAPMDKLEEALEQGRQDRLAAERAYKAPPTSSVRFR